MCRGDRCKEQKKQLLLLIASLMPNSSPSSFPSTNKAQVVY